MSIHQKDEKMLPDSLFVKGDIRFLVPGNKCRRLDNRRTPGFVESIDADSGMFRWSISKFEDKGKFWELPLEDVSRFQFEQSSSVLAESDIQRFKAVSEKFDKPLVVARDMDEAGRTEIKLQAAATEAKIWLKAHSKFFAENKSVNFSFALGPKPLRQDLLDYMKSRDLLDQERLTSETYVLNPSSGEWIKAIQIVLAELGLQDFRGKLVRSADLFSGVGDKAHLRNYILTRLGFLRGYFSLLKIDHVDLFRGMATGYEWSPALNTSFSSWTFSRKVAESFAGFTSDQNYRNFYLVKRSMPIEKLFMTYLETDAMNNQYEEVEAVVLHDMSDRSL